MSELYWSSSSKVLVSRHPLSIVEEKLSFYCPRCLTRYSDEETNTYDGRCPSCFNCPQCTSSLTTSLCLNTDTNAKNKVNKYQVLLCGYCSWRSDLVIDLKGEDKAELESIILEKERENVANESFQKQLNLLKETFDTSILNSLSSRSRLLSKKSLSSQLLSASLDNINNNDNSARQRMTLEDVEKINDTKDKSSSSSSSSSYWSNKPNNNTNIVNVTSIDNNNPICLATNEFAFTEESQRFHNAGAGFLVSSAYPTRIRLKTKRTVRSRLDLSQGKMSILVQPKAFPLEGDSSLIVSKGKWWVKDASAIHTVPIIDIITLPTIDSLLNINNTIIPTITIRISNPKENKVLVDIKRMDTKQNNEQNDVILRRQPFSFSVTNIEPYPCSSNDSHLYNISLAAYEDELLRENSDANKNLDNNDNVNFQDDHYWKHKYIDHTAIIKIPFEKIQDNNNAVKIYQYKLEINFKDDDSFEINNVHVLIAFTL